MQKILSMALDLCLLATNLPLTVRAEEANVDGEDILNPEFLKSEDIYELEELEENPMRTVAVSSDTSGTTGDCTWADTQTLTISGDGAMGDMTKSSNFSDYTWSDESITVIIDDSVKYIGYKSFALCHSLARRYHR